jgi:hypothetical protein
MTGAEDETVMRLRTGFLREAVLRVRELVAQGEINEAIVKGAEVRRYFEWIGRRYHLMKSGCSGKKSNLSPELLDVVEMQ